MPELSYDLHIHSCLSPCGSDDMTPANVVGMAALKGLDVIALTDHNSAKNCPAALKMGEEYGILVIPGMEINTSEEVHAVCLFPDLKHALAFDEYVYERLMKFPNNPEIFGRQLLYNDEDQLIGEEPSLLINAADISFDGLWELTGTYGGIMFPAHIDKSANSLLANLGFIPPDSRFGTVEIKNMARLQELKQANPYLDNCRVLSNSDAHDLGNINEPDHRIYTGGKTIPDVLEALR